MSPIGVTEPISLGGNKSRAKLLAVSIAYLFTVVLGLSARRLLQLAEQVEGRGDEQPRRLSVRAVRQRALPRYAAYRLKSWDAAAGVEKTGPLGGKCTTSDVARSSY